MKENFPRIMDCGLCPGAVSWYNTLTMFAKERLE